MDRAHTMSDRSSQDQGRRRDQCYFAVREPDNVDSFVECKWDTLLPVALPVAVPVNVPAHLQEHKQQQQQQLGQSSEYKVPADANSAVSSDEGKDHGASTKSTSDSVLLEGGCEWDWQSLSLPEDWDLDLDLDQYLLEQQMLEGMDRGPEPGSHQLVRSMYALSRDETGTRLLGHHCINEHERNDARARNGIAVANLIALLLLELFYAYCA
jgi:hypothetical protein